MQSCWNTLLFFRLAGPGPRAVPTGLTHASTFERELPIRRIRYPPTTWAPFAPLSCSLGLCPSLGTEHFLEWTNSFDRLTQIVGFPSRLAQRGLAPGVGNADRSACLLRRRDSWPR